MFWTGMAIFAVLAVLPFACAVFLNARDAAKSKDAPSTPKEL